MTLSVDFDSRTGLHLVAVDTSADGTFYAAGSDFRLVITAGTVDSISVVGTVVGAFSLSNRSALRPTVADRTLDVSSGGEAGVDWANVGSPTTTLDLSGTTISTSQAVASVSGNVGGNVVGSVGSLGATAKADVNAEVDSAIADVGLTTTITSRIDAEISSRSTYDGSDTAGTTTLLDRLGVPADLDGGADVASNLVDIYNRDAEIHNRLQDVQSDALTVADVLAAFGVVGEVADASATASGFDGDASLSDEDGWYVGSVLFFTGGALDGIARKVTGYTGATRTFAFTVAFPDAPADEDPFVLLGRID